LSQLAGALQSGGIQVVDLTQTLSPDFPQIALPPEMGQCWPFRIEEISHYDERGPGWYWNNFSCGEHTGTHFDAPASLDLGPPPAARHGGHAAGAEAGGAGGGDRLPRPGRRRPRLPADRGRHPGLRGAAWPHRPGQLGADAHRLVACGPTPEAYQNFDETGQHTPGPGTEAVQFLVEQRDVLGFGSEAIGTDAGQGFHLRPPYPCHYFMHGAGRWGLQCLCNLDQLPPTGSVLVTPPLKIEKGSGSPLRVLALVAR
jgi:kynurenine formamidase